MERDGEKKRERWKETERDRRRARGCFSVLCVFEYLEKRFINIYIFFKRHIACGGASVCVCVCVLTEVGQAGQRGGLQRGVVRERPAGSEHHPLDAVQHQDVVVAL